MGDFVPAIPTEPPPSNPDAFHQKFLIERPQALPPKLNDSGNNSQNDIPTNSYDDRTNRQKENNDYKNKKDIDELNREIFKVLQYNGLIDD